jgi:polyhydroxyalkanoate synthase subunit PhaC
VPGCSGLNPASEYVREESKLSDNSQTTLRVADTRAGIGRSNGRRDTNGRRQPSVSVGADDVGLDQLLAQAGRRRLVPGSEAGRLLVSLVRHPAGTARRASSVTAGLARALVGEQKRTPGRGDRRFADPAWTESWLFRRLLEGYLALAEAARALVEEADLDWENQQKLRLVVDNLIDALAPTNYPWSNPAAMKALIDQGGRNLVIGARALIRDMSAAPRIPANVDPTGFVLGETVAATPGGVVFRQPMYELLQYKPATPEVREIPVLFVPPMISKFYCVDLSPGRSLIEYLVDRGQQAFTISWKNATRAESEWDFDHYMGAII